MSDKAPSNAVEALHDQRGLLRLEDLARAVRYVVAATPPRSGLLRAPMRSL